jgi:peptidoglycan/LPS O-acetylase OafA/YrhL
MSESKHRLYIFDFIRALAVLFVIFGHYLVHHHHYEEHNEIWVKLHGLGVGMFFFISGYLIFMTLQKSTVSAFLFHRYFRIIPSLVASMVCFALFNNYFSGKSFLLGSLLVSDFFGEMGIYGIDIWTLHTETRFYLLMAGIYFFILQNRQLSKRRLLLGYLLAMVFILSAVFFYNIKTPGFSFAGPKWNAYCIGYLFFGVIFYLFDKKHIGFVEFLITSLINVIIILLIKIMAFGYVFSNAWKDNYLVASLLCIGLIAAKEKIPHSKIMAFVAYISYPLYLVHHDMIFKWGLMGIPVMIAVATMITVLIEQPVMKWSKRIL